MKLTSIVSVATLWAASSEAAAVSPRQRGWGGTGADPSECLTGNDAIDSLMSSMPIMSALCLSVMPQTTKVVSVSSSTQVTVIATITDTLVSPVGGTTRTVFFTTTGLTTRTVRVTPAASPSSTGGPGPGSTSNPAPPNPVTPAPIPITTTSSTIPTTSSTSSAAPAPPEAVIPACDAVGYAGNTAAYQFDGSGTNGNFANCSALCKADSKCQSFGYGNGACLLFNVPDTGNVNLVAGSPYRFFNRDCAAPIVARDFTPFDKRQFGFGGGFGGVGGTIGGGTSVTSQVSDACRCLFGSSIGSVTVTRTYLNAATVTVRSRSTITIPTTVAMTVTRTRQALSTVTVQSTVYVQPTGDATPTWDGGVGF